eukprot:3611009-Rhodomonas_salina.2
MTVFSEFRVSFLGFEVVGSCGPELEFQHMPVLRGRFLRVEGQRLGSRFRVESHVGGWMWWLRALLAPPGPVHHSRQKRVRNRMGDAREGVGKEERGEGVEARRGRNGGKRGKGKGSVGKESEGVSPEERGACEADREEGRARGRKRVRAEGRDAVRR